MTSTPQKSTARGDLHCPKGQPRVRAPPKIPAEQINDNQARRDAKPQTHTHTWPAIVRGRPQFDSLRYHVLCGERDDERRMEMSFLGSGRSGRNPLPGSQLLKGVAPDIGTWLVGMFVMKGSLGAVGSRFLNSVD